MSIGPMSAPYVLVPVVAAAQEVNVSMPGEEPELALDMVPEDMRLFDSSLVDKSGGHLTGGSNICSGYKQALQFLACSAVVCDI